MKKYGWFFLLLFGVGLVGLVNTNIVPLFQEYPQPDDTQGFKIIYPVPEGFVTLNEEFQPQIYVFSNLENVLSVRWLTFLDGANTSATYDIELQHTFSPIIFSATHPAISRTGKVDFMVVVTWDDGTVDGKTETYQHWFEVDAGIKSIWLINKRNINENGSLWSPLPNLTVTMHKLEGLSDYAYTVVMNVSTIDGAWLGAFSLDYVADATWQTEIQLVEKGEYLLDFYVYKSYNYPDPTNNGEIDTITTLDSHIRTYYLYGTPEINEYSIVWISFMAVGIVGTAGSILADLGKQKKPK